MKAYSAKKVTTGRLEAVIEEGSFNNEGGQEESDGEMVEMVTIST
jgi:hypothetical protein